jgi:transposase
MFCAALYLLESGCQWRMLPQDFPKWRTVHSYFAKWSERAGARFKKSGWRGLRQTGAQRKEEFPDR